MNVKPKTKTSALNIRCTEQMKKALEYLAKEDKATMSEVVERLIMEEYVSRCL